jgi:hypothetical protein
MLTIRQILDSLVKGTTRIPAFQRGFVWDADSVAYFMDSLYKGFPVGSLLFWRSKNQLKIEKKLGPFVLPDREPDYPIDYVLDGQQRITSIFGVFQTELKPEEAQDWTRVYFDYQAEANAQESQFSVLASEDKIDRTRHFPLNVLFNSVAYRKATEGLGEDSVQKIDKLQERFKEVTIPVQTFSTDDKKTVAIVFERVNRKGVPLDTLQLLSAWTWSDEFDLQQKFEELASELEPFKFDELGADTNLLLRCCAAVMARDASPDTLVDLNGDEVRARFDEVVNGIKGAIDFLRTNLEVQSLENLPYQTLLVPLSVFFAVPGNRLAGYNDAQRKTIVRWFWRTCFSRRYSSGVLRYLKTDIDEFSKLRGAAPSTLDQITTNIDANFFLQNDFRVDTVNTKTFVLMLANKKPLSFVSGAPISLAEVLKDSNRNEFHHLYPRSCLKQGNYDGVKQNALANFAFLSKADNIHLGGDCPSVYRQKMPGEPTIGQILKGALCPASLFNDNFETYLHERATLLTDQATKLME